MTTTAVDIVVKVAGGQKLDKLNRDLKGLDGTTKNLANKLPAAQAGLRNTGAAAKQAASGVQVLNAAFAKISVVIGVVSGAVAAFNAGIARTESERRITQVANAYGESAQLASVAAASAQKFGQSQTEANNALATTYARLRPVGVGLEEIQSVYNGFNTAARLAGASSEESAGAFRQLAQALGSGALRGDEFNSIAEQAPLVLQAVSKETGVAVGQLRDFAADGLITSDIVIKALQRIEKEGAGQLAESLKGPQQAIKNFQNAWEDFSATAGKAAQPVLIALVNGLTGILNTAKKVQPAFQLVLDALGQLAAAFSPLTDLLVANQATWDEWVKNIQLAYKIVAVVLGKVAGVIKSMATTWANILRNLFGFIGNFLGGVVSAIDSFFGITADQSAKGMDAIVQNVVNGIERIRSAIATLVNITGPGLITQLFGFNIGEAITQPIKDIGNGIKSIYQEAKNLQLPTLDDPGDLSSGLPGGGAGGAGGKGKGGGGRGRKGKNAAEEAAKLERKVAELTNRATELGEKLGVAFASKSTPLEEGILGVKRELAGADKELEEMLMKLDELTKGDPKFAAARSQINAIREQLAATDELRVASERLTQSDKEGLEKSVRELEQKLQLLREGRTEFTELEKLVVKYGEDWEKLDPAVRKHLEGLAATKEALKANVKEAEKQLERQKKMEELVGSVAQRVGTAIEDSIVSAIDAAVDGTKDLGQALQEIASSLLKDVGRMLLRTGINSLMPTFAAGGRPEVGRASIVGENGPELFIPDTAGRVDGSEAFNAARQAMTTSSAVQSSTAALDREQEQIEMMQNPSSLDVRFETYSIGGMDVVTRDEAMKISEQSAKKARAQVFADMRNKPATRKQLGLV